MESLRGNCAWQKQVLEGGKGRKRKKKIDPVPAVLCETSRRSLAEHHMLTQKAATAGYRQVRELCDATLRDF